MHLGVVGWRVLDTDISKRNENRKCLLVFDHRQILFNSVRVQGKIRGSLLENQTIKKTKLE